MRMARIRPTDAAINEDAPQSGIRPIFVADSMKYAASEAITISQASASDTPPPTAGSTVARGDDGMWDRGDRAHGAVCRTDEVCGRPRRSSGQILGPDGPARAERAACGPYSRW